MDRNVSQQQRPRVEDEEGSASGDHVMELPQFPAAAASAALYPSSDGQATGEGVASITIGSPPHPPLPELQLNADGAPTVGVVPEGSQIQPNTVQKADVLIRKWPSYTMQLMNETDDDEWRAVMERIESHPDEITIQGKNGGQNALHAACVRYPPSHVIQAMLLVRPEAALQQNFNGETPLHLASFSASEEVQEMLVRAAPMTVGAVDQYGDCPLHAAARLGAMLPLMEQMLRAAPSCISLANNRGVTPFWLLPRSYLEAEDLEEIFDEEAEDYRDDWDLMVLTLRYAYFGTERQPPVDEQGNPVYDWLVHAAAATPSCPRDTLKFLCGLFPQQALCLDHNGFTPLHLAVQAPVMVEPKNWDENEDGFREHVEVAEVALNDGLDAVLPVDEVAALNVDSAYLQEALRPSADEEQEDEETAISILLECNPRAALRPDSEKRLPLTHAIATGKPWKIVRKIVQTCPLALETRDYKTGGLYMFQLAAMHSDLETIYHIVRSLPELMGMARVVVSDQQEHQRDAVAAGTERPMKQARTDSDDEDDPGFAASGGGMES